MLFFLATLLIIIAWWFGLMIETLRKHRSYQANTIKNKRARSFIHLARMAFRHEPQLLNWNIFRKVMSDLQSQYHSFHVASNESRVPKAQHHR
ncbi:transposase (plasmid) [Legionella adelaidensis]|uniref:Transposase n=1 Tax=Legionella adelaidensis TaxID=45056 RepID=A0A0W0R200_9GAMM|nr:transposase [Legionella adelaidensis]VEH85360.1 transposase [Legionella adelaidensis]